LAGIVQVLAIPTGKNLPNPLFTENNPENNAAVPEL